MASILRSSKFVRYIAGFAKNVVVNTPREFDGNLINTATVQTSQCLCGAIPRSLTTQTSTQHDQNLERRLKTLDQDVRKSGRISRRDIEDVLEEIRNARSATSSQSLLVIRCCGNLVPDELPEVRTKLVQEIWRTLDKLNVPMDVSHYNALLRVYLENEHPFSPTEFLSDMESKGIEPNRVTYQRLISRYCQEGDIEGATKILEYMREKEMPVNENVFNALIFGHSQAGDMESAHGILSVMAQAGLETSADTYTTLLCGYAKEGNMEKIDALFNECEEKDIYLLDKDYLDIIYSLATNGHKQHIPTILSKTRKAFGYNQDAINLILRLINKNQEDSAFAVLKTIVRGTRPDGTLYPVGNFFIRQLVKSNRDVNTVVSYCKELEEEGMYENALLFATECSLAQAREHLAYGLLEQLRTHGIEIRQHFFWPLIVSSAEDSSGKGILNVLQKMQSFGLSPNNETLRDWVLPNLKGNSSELLALLRDANVPVASSSASLLINLLSKNEIKEAATIAASVKAYYAPELVKRPLTNALYATKDVSSYIAVLRQVHDNLKRLMIFSSETSHDGPSVVGSFLTDLCSNQRGFPELIPVVLEQLVEEGLSITTTSAEIIETRLGEKMTERISDMLGQLTSGELTPAPLSKKPSYIPFSQMNVDQLEKLVQNLDAKNIDTLGYKRRLLSLYHREKNLEKMENLLEQLKNNQNFEFTAGIHAILMDTYAANDQLEKALEQLEQLKKIEGESFEIDEMKAVRIAGLFAKNGKMEEAIKFLEETPRDKGERGYPYTSLIWRILYNLAEAKRAEDLERLLQAFLKNEYVDVSNVVLGPLIKVYINMDDLNTALQKFEWCVEHYKLTPWKNELACKLIAEEDAEKLQKLTDLSTVVHGEINSLYDLVFAFVECGRIRQARKILETPGLQNRPQRINNACERFQQEGLVKPLEGLKDATKDLHYIDRSDIYYQLLLSYIKQNDAEKSLGLWTQMQEEDLPPSDQFLLTLGSFLQEKGLQVPFVIPQPKIIQRPADTSNKIAQVKPVQTTQIRRTKPAPVNEFKLLLDRGDLNGCLQILKSQEKVSLVETSHLIEKLIHQDRLDDATSITLDMINKGLFPVQKIFRFLLNKLASAGQVERLSQIGEKLSTDVKRLVSFDNRLCHANIVAGNVDEYLRKLENDIDNVAPENLEMISSQFPRGGAYGILEKYPEYIDRFEQIAIKYARKGIIGPLNVLWTKYFINNNTEKASQLWEDHLKNAPRIMFQKIIQTARDVQDEDLIKRLLNHLKISNVTPGAIGNAYSCYLDVLVAKNKFEEIVQVFERAVSQIPIDAINRTAVMRVKEVYEKLGKPFGYTIPKRNKTGATQENEEA